MGCNQSNVKKSEKKTDIKTDRTSVASQGPSASNPASRQRSNASKHRVDSTNSLVVCNEPSADDDDDDDHDDVVRGDVYSEHCRKRNSASSMPDSRHPTVVEDHFAPVELPPALQPSNSSDTAPTPRQKPFNTALEDHEKTDSAQAEQQYRRVLEQKREAQSMETALREMEEFDPIRPMDSFNITHRGLLGRCWDRRSAELVPIAFLHAIETNTAASYSTELARDGSVNAHRLVRAELRVMGSGESVSDGGSPSSPDAGYPGAFPSRDWSALRRQQIGGGHAPSEVTDGTGHSPASQAPSMSPTTSVGVPRRSHWFSVCGVASHTVPWGPTGTFGNNNNNNASGGRGTPRAGRPGPKSRPASTNSLFTLGSRVTEEDTQAGLPTPEVLMGMSLVDRIDMYTTYMLQHERFMGAKGAFAFSLSSEVDDGQDTRFLRSRNLSPAKGVKVVRWNRVEFFNPSLRTLTLAAMDASLGRYETRDQSANFAVAAANGEIGAELQAMGSSMFLDGNVSFGQHLLADIKNRSFIDGRAQTRNNSILGRNNSSLATGNANNNNNSFFQSGSPGGGTTLAEGNNYTAGGSHTGLEFPEESVLCLAMAVPTSRLFWGDQFRGAIASSPNRGTVEDTMPNTAMGKRSVTFQLLRNFSFTAPQPPKSGKAATKTASSSPVTSAPAVPTKRETRRPGRLVATPVSAGPRAFPSNTAGSSYSGSPTTRLPISPNTSTATVTPSVTTHMVAFNVSSFSASIDPFHWESLQYTRFPVDLDATKSSSRRQYGEGVITDVMYGGTLIIECNSPEAAAELERMLDTVVWTESRNLRAIAQGVHKRMKNRLAERAAGARRRRKQAEQKEKEKEKEKEKSKSKEKGKDKDKDKAKAEAAAAAKDEDAESGVMGQYAFRIMRRIGGRPIRDAVELKHIAFYLGDQGVQEKDLSRPERGASAMFNNGVSGGAEITPSFSRVASAWTGLETMAAVVETWGLHLLAQPSFAQPTSLYLQKFSGLVPVLLHTSLMPVSLNASTNASEAGDDAEEDRFFAPELEPPATVMSNGSSTGVAKRIPKYNRFYSSLPNTPMESSPGGSLGRSGSGSGAGRGGRGSLSPGAASLTTTANASMRGAPSPGALTTPQSRGGDGGRIDSLSFADDSFRAGLRGQDAMAISRTQCPPRRGLPSTLSCETMPGATNFSLPASDMDGDDDDDHSTVHSDHARPHRSMTALPRTDTAPGGVVASSSMASTLPPSAHQQCRRDSDAAGGGASQSSSQFWSSGMYPTEDNVLAEVSRAPTLIFCPRTGVSHEEDGAHAEKQTTNNNNNSNSNSSKEAAHADSRVAVGGSVRPSRVIVKRRPSDSSDSAVAAAAPAPETTATAAAEPAIHSTTDSAFCNSGPSTPLPTTTHPHNGAGTPVFNAALENNASLYRGVSMGSVYPTEQEEQWSMAMLEVRAMQAELEDMQNAVRVAQDQLMAKEEEQRTLFRAFLPFTSMNKLDAIFLYLKTAIHEPDDLPHGCLYLDTPDWLSLLYAVWTSPRNHVRQVSVVYELMCKDLPKVGLLAGLLYFENSTVGLDRLTLNASKMFGTAIPPPGSTDHVRDGESVGGLGNDSLATAGRGQSATTDTTSITTAEKREGNWFSRRRRARRRDPASVGGAAHHGSDGDGDGDEEAAEERDAQRYQHFFLTHPQQGGPQMLHYGFGIVSPLYYVTAEQARDTLWWLLCAIAENAQCADTPGPLSRRTSKVDTNASNNTGDGFVPSNAFTLSLAGLPKDKAHYLIPKSRSFSSFFHRRGASKDTKQLAAGSSDWVNEDAMQLENGFIVLSESPSGFVFEDGASPLGGASGSFNQEIELSADPRKRHKKGGAIETPLRRSANPSLYGSMTNASSLKSDLNNATFALHEHNYGKRAWMHAEAKVEIRPFCHVLYHNCVPTATALEQERERLREGDTLDTISGPRVSHYHLPFNRVHNHAEYYRSPERRLELVQAATKAISKNGAADTDVVCDPSTEALLMQTPARPIVFGLQSEEEERSVLLEEEGRLFRHTEDIWEVLRRSVKKYNKALGLRMTHGDPSELDELGLVKRPILLER